MLGISNATIESVRLLTNILAVLSIIAFIALGVIFAVFPSTLRYIISKVVIPNILYIAREFYSYPTSVIAVISILSAVIAIKIFSFGKVAVATVFYATVLFATNLIEIDRPYPEIVLDQLYYDESYGRAPDQRGFEYEFSIQNSGMKELVNPKIQYTLFNSDYSLKSDWQPVQDTGRQTVRIKPGEIQEEFKIQADPITKEEKTDFYLIIRVIPRRGNWLLAKWWTVNVG